MFIFPLSVSSFVILFCLWIGLRTVAPNATKLAPHAWLADLGAGFLTMFATLIVALGLAATLIGIPLALLLGVGFVVFAMVAMALSLPDAGDWVQQIFPSTYAHNETDLARPLLGAGALLALSLIPFVGWFAMALYSWLATGRVVRTLVARHQARNRAVAQVHPASDPAEHWPMSI